MLLGYVVSKRGIKANPEKITAITRMGPIQNVKGYSGSWDASRLSAISYRTSTNEASSSTIVNTKRKLWHYFESHPVTVVLSFLLGEVI
jgi:hypothetical protein